jgi:hypothetical protein
MSADISNAEDVIDSRDLIERIDDLKSEQDALVEEYEEAREEAEGEDTGEGWEHTERLTNAINALSDIGAAHPKRLMIRWQASAPLLIRSTATKSFMIWSNSRLS